MMMIRETDRPSLPRLREKDNEPLRRTARELGIFLEKLTAAAHGGAAHGADTVDDALQAKNRSASRKFKMPSEGGAAEAVFAVGLSEEQEEILPLLKEARALAAAAATPRLPVLDRDDMQARFEEVFSEFESKPAAGQLSRPSAAEGAQLSLLSPDGSHEAYRAVDDLIAALYNLAARPADATAGRHEAAINASEHIKEFLLSEGPAKAFGRFRDIDRSNVLGLLR